MFFLENDYLLEEEVQPTNLGLEGLEGALLAVSECDEVWFNLREKMMKLEHTAIVTEDTMLLEEGKKSFKVNVKGMFASLKAKVEELFRNFMDWIGRLVGNDKALIEKLKDAKPSKPATVKGYSFDKLAAYGENVAKAATKFTNPTGEDAKAENFGAILSALSISKQASSASEFTKALREEAFGGTEKTEQQLSKDEVLRVLTNAKDAIAKAKRTKSAIQKLLDAAIKADAASGQERMATKNYAAAEVGLSKKQTDNGLKADGKAQASRTAAYRHYAKYIVIAYGIYIEGLKTERLQARAAVSQLIGKGKEKAEEKVEETTTTNESMEFVGILGQF